jgi:ABC-2 type transport system ATP-binding protein
MLCDGAATATLCAEGPTGIDGDAPGDGAMLTITDLHKRYGDVAALDGLSMTARPGRLLGFLGPNGAGKTTTMRAVFGLVGLDRGTVTWRDAPITQAEMLRFGYMPEQRGLYPRMAAAAQLTYLARLHGMGAAEASTAADRWLRELGLGDRMGDPVNALSHGNQQRVQLAASLVHEPDLLVLDEPFNGLDPIGVSAMSDVLRERADDGATVVFSSHQLDLVEALCDDVVIIASGRDRIAGTLDDVRAATGHRRVELRLVGGEVPPVPEGVEPVAERDGLVTWRVPADTDPASMLEKVATYGQLERFAFEPPTLSEIFRDVVGITIDAAEAAHADDDAEVPA